jgi:hypothetical protein
LNHLIWNRDELLGSVESSGGFAGLVLATGAIMHAQSWLWLDYEVGSHTPIIGTELFHGLD